MKKARWVLQGRKVLPDNKVSMDFQDPRVCPDQRVRRAPWDPPARTDPKATEALRVSLDSPATTVPPDVRAKPDLLVLLDGMDATERTEPPVSLDDRVLPACPASPVHPVFPAPRVSPQSDSLERQARRASRACPACQVFPDLQDETDSPARKATEASLDYPDREDLPVNRECRATPVSGRSDRKETPVTKDPSGHRARPVPSRSPVRRGRSSDLRALLDPRAIRVNLEKLDLVAIPAMLDTLASLDFPE